MRRNRGKPGRISDWTRRTRESDGYDLENSRSEQVTGKGDVSRRRTVTLKDSDESAEAGLTRGTVIAMRGLYAEVDDGQCIRLCTVRRMLRTRLIKERHPVTVGDHVQFKAESDHQKTGSEEGAIESVDPRRGQLVRRVGRRIQTIVANVDQAIIVSSADEPPPRPNLIDRYGVAALAGGITPVICMNKIDLDRAGQARRLLDRYAELGWAVVRTSVPSGEGIDELRGILRGRASVIAGQSGVGKSSLLNSVQPGLDLRIGETIKETGKGRHTTTTASLIRLEVGGYVVDTPGVRSFDMAVVPRHELEAHFVEFLPHIPHCKFPDCSHTHEAGCAVKRALEEGRIHPQRYESYVRLYEERPDDRG